MRRFGGARPPSAPLPSGTGQWPELCVAGRWQVAGTADWPVAAQQQPSSAGASPACKHKSATGRVPSRGGSCCL